MNKICFGCKGFYLIRILLIFLTVVSIFAILWIRSNVITIEYRLSQLEEKKKYLIKEQKVLIAEKSSLTSIAKIEQSGLAELQFPDRNKVVYVTKNIEPSINKVSFSRRD
jgi:cell division protein FtsL